MAKKVLFFANSEYGQVNVVFTTAYELLLQGYEVRIASFTGGSVTLGSSYRPAAQVPVILGPSITKAITRHFADQYELMHGHGIKEALRMYPYVTKLVCVWEVRERVQSCQRCVEVTEEVHPDIIVVDKFCPHGVDACKTLDRKYVMILSPSTFKETIYLCSPGVMDYGEVQRAFLDFCFPFHGTLFQ
ncbi:hypothetical protein B0O99DRAFT_595484 [Bisporella sp. PMI_857]|nr:hypothetical protein B0O99DRAFT_595484 [Bisporella sp. PMI_857]